MEKKAILYDLDNTLYPVPAIGEKLFGPVFELIAASGQHDEDMPAIKKDMMRIPFRVVAKTYNFNAELINKGIEIQEGLEYNEPIDTFEDYKILIDLPGKRFLVTTGFKKMQESKIRNMGIAEDFTEIHIVDPTITSKKEVFSGIMQRYNYLPKDILVVGDDPDSEIKAAKDLGIESVLYSLNGEKESYGATYVISNYSQLEHILENN